MEITVFIGGEIDELFMCDIQDLELPLGFEVKADALICLSLWHGATPPQSVYAGDTILCPAR